MSGLTDRELLEGAARAAGIGPVIGFAVEAGELIIGPRNSIRYWNPLARDGQALRLAAKLEMDICFHSEGAELLNADPHIYTDSEDGDQMQATRRAIVRAAYEMGSAKP